MAGPGTLHLRFDLRQPLEKTLSVAARTGWTYQRDNNHIAIHVRSSSLMPVLEPLAAALETHELSDVRVAFEADGQQADWFETGSLYRFFARQQSGWLIDMIQQDRITSLFQPIVSAIDGQLYGYECLLRGIEGNDGETLVAATRMLQVACGAGILPTVDQAARCSAIRQAARHKVRCKIFINFSPTAFEDAADMIDPTVRLLEEHGIARRQVVFEITESERIADPAALERTLDRYRQLDFEIALDDVGSGYSSLNLLQRLRPDYSKLDQQLVRNVHSDGYKAVLTSKLLEANHELGVKTIAEGVESEAEDRWLRAHGTDYLQGYYFARPASPPPAVMAA